MDRLHFEQEHEAFGAAFRAHLDKNVVPNYLDWCADGIAPRDVFATAGRHGFLGMAIPEEHGGGGVTDFRYNQVLAEQVAAAGVAGVGIGMMLQNDICLPYFLDYCDAAQQARWLPGIASGQLITAVAMTEPGTGSDLAGIHTSAQRDGATYVLNGAKTFITNGINSDLVIVVARTSLDRHAGVSLLVVERGMPGFERGRNLDKIGLHAQDTAELSFVDVRVPVENLVGEEGAGFRYLTEALAQERMSLAVSGVAEAGAALAATVGYVSDRKAFGSTLSSFQNTRFVLAGLAAEIDAAQAFVDRCVDRLNDSRLTAGDASKAKLIGTELQGRVTDACLQLYGGYGYMNEYTIARRYADARVSRIYGGTSEVMKMVIAKELGL